MNNEQSNNNMSRTLEHCTKQFNFADPKWDDKNFPDYKENNNNESNKKEQE